MRYQYRILGSLTVTIDGKVLLPPERRIAEVITTLAVHAGGWVPVPSFLSLLWEPGREKPHALRTHIYMTRKYLHDPDKTHLINKRGSGYQLRIDPADLDLTVFRQLSEDGDTALRRGDIVSAVDLFGRALALWTGDQPLKDFPETTGMCMITDKLQKEHAAVQDAWLEARMMLGEHRELLPVLDTMLRDDPCHDRRRAMQMTALYRCGRQAAALEAFQQARAVLAAGGLEPGEEIIAVRDRIERGDAELLRPGPMIGTTTSRLVSRVPRQLPPPLPDFTGRDHDQAQLVRLLTVAEGHAVARQVAVTGPPGVGKSSLAVQVAHRVQEEFPDGQFYIRLQDTSGEPIDPTEALAEALRVLSVQDVAMPPTTTGRTDLFRSLLADQRVLLVLDDAVDVEQVRPLLPGTAGCGVIITTQDQLIALTGAKVLRLEAPPEAESLDLLQKIAGTRRVERQMSEAKQIIAACRRSPLAVRAAGVRLQTRRTWPLSSLAEALTNGGRPLDQLSVGGLTVRASIARSFGRLSDEEAAALQIVTTAGAAGCGGWLVSAALGREAGEILASLTDRSLVEDLGMDPLGNPRYRAYGLVSYYCWERLASSDGAEEAFRRAMQSVAELTEMATAHLLREDEAPPPSQVRSPRFADAGGARPIGDDARAWLGVEWRTIAAVVESACRMGQYREGFDLACRLSQYLRVCDRHDDDAALWHVIEPRDIIGRVRWLALLEEHEKKAWTPKTPLTLAQ